MTSVHQAGLVFQQICSTEAFLRLATALRMLYLQLTGGIHRGQSQWLPEILLGRRTPMEIPLYSEAEM